MLFMMFRLFLLPLMLFRVFSCHADDADAFFAFMRVTDTRMLPMPPTCRRHAERRHRHARYYAYNGMNRFRHHAAIHHATRRRCLLLITL